MLAGGMEYVGPTLIIERVGPLLLPAMPPQNDEERRRQDRERVVGRAIRNRRRRIGQRAHHAFDRLGLGIADGCDDDTIAAAAVVVGDALPHVQHALNSCRG